jgi:hypothetical protein
VLVIYLLVVSKFLVMKAKHTVASCNGRDFTSKFIWENGIALIWPIFILRHC